MRAVEDWKTEPLGRVARLTMGQSPDSRYYSEEENGLPFLQGCAEFKGRFPIHSLYCSQIKKIATVGSILFSVRAPVGRINIADRDYIIGRGLAGISGIEVDQAYLEHYLTFVEPNFRNASQGSTFEAINSSELNGWPIEHPVSKTEQTKIAEVLSTVDRTIEQTEALIAKQQRIKTGLMQGLLTRGIDEHGNLRSEQTHKFKDSPLGRIPVEWQVKPLGQVSNLITNGFVGVATPHYTESSEGIPYLYGNNVRNNYVDLTKVTLINRSFHSKQHKSQLQPGDMLTVQSGHIGTTAVVPDSLSESNCHALIIMKFKKEMLSPDFVSFYCNFCLETGSMSHLFIGSTIKHINTSDFAKFAIPFPPKDEQFQIAHRLLDLSNTVNIAGAKLTKLRSLKTALMQDLLTGKKSVAALLEETP